MLDEVIHRTLQAKTQDVGQACTFAPTPSGCRQDWFVVATKPQAERRAHAALHLKGYQPYLPMITVRTPKREYRTTALFPGYLFVVLDLSHPWYPIRYAPGVFGLICTEGVPTRCQDGTVEALQASEGDRRYPTLAESLWRPGAACRLATGPFQGCDAVVLSVGTDMALVSLMMLGQLRNVAVALSCLMAREEM